MLAGGVASIFEKRVMKIEDILVPIYFSPGSLQALDYALALVDWGGEVYLLRGLSGGNDYRDGEGVGRRSGHARIAWVQWMHARSVRISLICGCVARALLSLDCSQTNEGLNRYRAHKEVTNR
jgi:hypothetical protein